MRASSSSLRLLSIVSTIWSITWTKFYSSMDDCLFPFYYLLLICICYLSALIVYLLFDRSSFLYASILHSVNWMSGFSQSTNFIYYYSLVLLGEILYIFSWETHPRLWSVRPKGREGELCRRPNFLYLLSTVCYLCFDIHYRRIIKPHTNGIGYVTWGKTSPS